MNSVSYTRRDPFAEFDALVRRSFGPGRSQTESALDYTPAAESFRDGDDAVVRLDLPGVDVANDVTVEAVAGRLVVRGERRDTRAEGDDAESSRTIREIRYGTFERTFGLPPHVTADAVSASYDAGVLTIRVAAVYAGTEPTRIEISQG